MEKERGMEEHYVTPALQEFPQLSRLPFLSPQNQGVIADYLAYLRARHYAPAVIFPRRLQSFQDDCSGGPKTIALQGRHGAAMSQRSCANKACPLGFSEPSPLT